MPSIALWLLVLAVIALAPNSLNRWDLPKELLVTIGCVGAALSVPSARLPRWALVVAGAAVLLLTIATASSEAPLTQLWGRWPRYDGLVSLPVYAAAAWAGARLLGGTNSAPRRKTFTNAVACAAILVGIISGLEACGLRPLASVFQRPGSLLGNATDQGIVSLAFATLLISPTATAWATERVRSVYLASGLTLALASVVLSASRAAIAATALVALVAGTILILRGRSRRHRKAAITMACGAIVLAGLALAVPLTRQRFVQGGFLLADRLPLWSEATRLLARHWLTGVGPDGLIDAISPFQTVQWFRTGGEGVTLDSSHNALLDIAIAGGIPLAALAIGAVVALTRSGVLSVRSLQAEGHSAAFVLSSLAALAGMGLILMTYFVTPATAILGSILIGAVIAQPTSARVPQRSAWAGVVRGVTLSAMVLLIAASLRAEQYLQSGVLAASAASGSNNSLSDADASFADAQKLRPWDADVPSIAGQTFAVRAMGGDPDAAALATSWSAQAVRQAPHSVLALGALAVGQQYTGDFADAAATLVAIERLAPNDPEVAHRLGGVLALEGKYPAALIALGHAAELAPRSSPIWQTIFFVYSQQGDEAGMALARAHFSK